MIKRSRQTAKREPTIALINIVFLMLVFFMVAGTLAQPLSPDLTLAKASDLEGRSPPDALILMADGTLQYRGAVLPSIENWDGITPDKPIRVVPDRAAKATDLLKLAAQLRSKNATKVLIVTETALK